MSEAAKGQGTCGRGRTVYQLAGSGFLRGAGIFIGSWVPKNFINGFVIIIFMFFS